jgi:4-phytase/acid phosphatase
MTRMSARAAFVAAFVSAFVLAPDIRPALAQTDAQTETTVLTIIVTRHGVRAMTKPAKDSPYTWANWSPLGWDDLTGHGYRMMRRMGEFYRDEQRRKGLAIPPGECAKRLYVYADVPAAPRPKPPPNPPPDVPKPAQRTLGTAHALIEGLCGAPDAVEIFHARDVPDVENPKEPKSDPIFDATDALTVDIDASRQAVAGVLGTPAWTAVLLHPGDFYAFQELLDQRCTAGNCAPLASKYKESAISVDGKLAALKGPVASASNFAENIFLEFAQCRPERELARLDGAQLRSDLAAGMRLHVLAYDVNARNRYNSLVTGETLLAHIAAMFDKKAGRTVLADIGAPDLADKTLVIFSGHDTQLGALGGVLDAHWNPGGGLMTDDMPPGSALIFDLVRVAGNYVVRLRFVSRPLDRFRDETPFTGAPTRVGFAGPPAPVCGPGGECVMRLEDLETQVLDNMEQFVVKGWKAWSKPSKQDPGSDVRDPAWTQCGLP